MRAAPPAPVGLMHMQRRHPSSRPFMAAPRPQFLHPAGGIDSALTAVERAIRRAEGVALVVGPPGTGKSLLLAKLSEQVRDDFDVALLSGARICTRRALWQSMLESLGEPYRGIGETELRMAVVERIRTLAATGSGLVILVDEAHTLPGRLIDELRLLSNVPTPLPAVHIVLSGSTRLEELLGLPRMESLAQRVAVRAYLEPLDHAETLAYLRTQTRVAGLDWDRLFEPGCDDAVFSATDGVPRLINLLCDQALLATDGSRRVTPADIASAWGEIQRLPVSPVLATARGGSIRQACDDPLAASVPDSDEPDDETLHTIEFGRLDDLDDRPGRRDAAACDPWHGPEVELVFDGSDPFSEFFQEEERVVDRYLMRGPDHFADHRHVESREGRDLGRWLADCERLDLERPATEMLEPARSEMAPETDPARSDDSDMVVIEEDLEAPAGSASSVFAVRPGDYRTLFSRLRGDRPG
jgi:type II secretory pathway predicted ATPase ExeA